MVTTIGKKSYHIKTLILYLTLMKKKIISNKSYVIDTDEKSYNIKGNKEVRVVAVVRSPITGISLTFMTTEPGFQFYTGSVVSDQFKAKATQSVKPLKLAKYSAFCLEAQRFPDAINQEKFKKQVILKYGERYEQKTIYQFRNN
jgi:galactose mutarotase-like enzyme